MPSLVEFRRGTLEDLKKFPFAKDLSATSETVEFNIIGMGHEFWVAIKGGLIVGLTVLGRNTPGRFSIIHLQVAPSEENRGIGSGMVRAIIEHHSDTVFVVVPFEGTEEFYRRLGFERASQWEMRFEPRQHRTNTATPQH